MRNDKQSEEVSIEKTVETTIQILYDKGLFDNCDNADEVNERRRPDLEEVYEDDVVTQ